MLIFLILHLLWTLGAAVWVPRRQRLPSSAAVWLALVALLPVVGSLLYLLFAPQCRPQPPRAEYPERDPLAAIIGCGCGTRPSRHNRVELLHNGNNAFLSLISALQHATESIHLEYYIFRDDRIGRTIADILARKARAGVEVRIIYDAFGSWHLSRRTVRELRRAGVRTAVWEPLRFPWFTRCITRRNHRKIVVVDGRTAFLGGVNIAEYYLDGDDLGRWRDEHLRLEGDAVADLQRLFVTDWNHVTGERLDVGRYIARHRIRHRSVVHIAWAGSGSSRLTLVEAFAAAIVRARRHIRISSPYFMPPAMILDALRVAAHSGVRVEVLVPRQSDSAVADLVSESYFGDLLSAGVELYRYDRGFLHAKLLVVDDDIASIGTANMDYRSLLDNLEVTAFIRDRGDVLMVAEAFDRDRAVSRRVVEDRLRYLSWRRFAGDLLRFTAPFM